MEARSIAAVEAAMEAIWLNNFLMDKSLVSSMQMVVTLEIAERLQVRRNIVFIR